MVGTERFLPGRHQIESFGNGGFRLGGLSHHGSIVITPNGVRACSATDVSILDIEHFEAILAERSKIDMLLIGTGRDMLPLSKTVTHFLAQHALAYDTMSTNAAVRIYNVVESEGRRVAAVLIAVNNARG